MTLTITLADPSAKDSAKAKKVELPAEVFDVPPTSHSCTRSSSRNSRPPVRARATKTRGEVRGGGKKPYRQKGTGRARQGSTRAPQFNGGGVVHGPQPRSYDQRTPKKMKAAALQCALSDRARNDRLHVVTSLVTGDVPSTKDAAATLAAITQSRHILVVAERTDGTTWKSLRNLDGVHLLEPGQLNTYDVLLSDDIVFTQTALEAFLNGPAKGRPARGTAGSSELAGEPIVPSMVESEAADAEVAKTVNTKKGDA